MEQEGEVLERQLREARGRAVDGALEDELLLRLELVQPELSLQMTLMA